MLAANVCASRFLEESKQPTLYRVHEGPSEDRLLKLRTFLGEFGFQLGGGDKPHAKDYAALLALIGDRPDRQLLQTVMLRSLRQAVYSPDNVGHFGLAYEAYTHFTSPIRRYPDLLVHRAIKAALVKKRYEPGDWSDIGLHCSTTERRADEASRDVQNWLKCYFMQDHVGEEFEGSVSAVVPFGLFVALDNVFIEGLVHISELGADYFHYDEGKHRLVGERSGRMYRLADRVRIQVVRVDLDNTRIEFRLAGGSADDFARVPRATRTQDASVRGRKPRHEPHQVQVRPADDVSAGSGRAKKSGLKSAAKSAVKPVAVAPAAVMPAVKSAAKSRKATKAPKQAPAGKAPVKAPRAAKTVVARAASGISGSAGGKASSGASGKSVKSVKQPKSVIPTMSAKTAKSSGSPRSKPPKAAKPAKASRAKTGAGK